MIYEDLVKRLREGCFAPITRLPIQSDEARLRRAAADALEHMAASEYALAKEIDALVKELDEARHHAQARLVALREVEAQLKDAIARAEKAEIELMKSTQEKVRLRKELRKEQEAVLFVSERRDALLKEAGEALEGIEDWWLKSGMVHFNGSPAAMFNAFAVLARIREGMGD